METMRTKGNEGRYNEHINVHAQTVNLSPVATQTNFDV